MSSDDDVVFRTPIVEHVIEHRPKLNPQHVYSACVARPVTRQEARQNAKATAALDKEWTKLRNMQCWGEKLKLKNGTWLPVVQNGMAPRFI